MPIFAKLTSLSDVRKKEKETLQLLTITQPHVEGVLADESMMVNTNFNL